MRIDYTDSAFNSLMSLVRFIESKNKPGAGLRWLNRYEHFLQAKLLNAKQIRFCNNNAFKRLQLRCIYFNNWIIAFSIYEDVVLIEVVFNISRIVD